MGRAMAVVAAALVVGGLAPTVSPVGDGVALAADGVAMPFDFDGDGYADLTIGVPFEDLRGKRDAGVVQVLYGSAAGVTARDQLWHQGRKGVKGTLGKQDWFGYALASGDFDSDGYADLAVGVPGEDVGSIRNAGAVQVLYGGPRGLTTRDQIWHQGKRGVPGSNHKNDLFGGSLAAGDFDGDGYADLVVGMPAADVGTLWDAGQLVLLHGGPGGLTSAGAQEWRQGRGGIPSQPAQVERFGAEMVAGDTNGDGRDDLAILSNFEADSPTGGAAVFLLLGGEEGLTADGNRFFLPSDLGFTEVTPFTATFGDFNRDGRDDLVLSCLRGTAVLHGRSEGIVPGPLPVAGLPGVDAMWPVGAFGLSGAVAAGDLTGDGHPDLAVGSNIVLGTATGLGPEIVPWALEHPGGAGAVSVLPFSGGSHAWLAAQTVARPVHVAFDPGAVTVLRGAANGDPGTATVWSQDSPGIKGTSETGDQFGFEIGR